MGSRKVNNKIKAILIVALVLSLSGTAIFLSWRYKPIKQILISSDFDITRKYNFPGTGTEEDPYMIDGYLFSESDYTSIYIASVTKYFVIQNCIIQSTHIGIELANLPVGGVKILNNTIRGNFIGFMIRDCENCIISGNKFENNDWGIDASAGNYSIVGNSFLDNKDGIIICDCYNTIIANNIVKKCYRGIQITRSQNVSILSNNCTESGETGIRITDVQNSICKNNHLNTNNITGIIVQDSDSIKISNNSCTNSVYGMLLQRSNITSINFNQLEHNEKYGIYLEGVNTTLWNNNFIDNDYNNITSISSQAYAKVNWAGTVGYPQWFDGETERGNYWSELVWFTSVEYIIYPGNYTDSYPLENPIEIKI